MQTLSIVTALVLVADALLVIPYYVLLKHPTLIMTGMARGTLSALCIYIVAARSLVDHDAMVILLLGILATTIANVVSGILFYLRMRHAFRLLD